VGVLAGLAALTRTNGLLLLPVLAAVLWRGPRRTWRTAVPAVGVLVVGLVLVAAWSVRNSLAFDAPTALTTQVGFTLAGTYNDVSRTDERLPAAWSPAPVPPYASTLQRTDIDEREANGELVAIARRYIRDRPTYVVEVGFWNSVRLLGLQGTLPDAQGAAEVLIGPRTAKAVTYSVYPLLILVLAGIALGALRRVPRWTWLLPVLLWLSLVPVSAGHSRYRIVIDGFLLVIAAYAIVTLATRVHERRREPLGH
jgi:hypothetical protein